MLIYYTITENTTLYYLDERGFNLHMSINYGYTTPNNMLVTFQPASQTQNLSSCCIISNSGIRHYEIIEGGYNTTKFIDFINNTNSPENINPNSIIIMDNDSIHKINETITTF